MSGAAGGSRINKENLKATIRDYRDNILKPLGLDKSYSITGVRSRPEKNIFGDIDIVVSFQEGNKVELKKKIGEFLNQIEQIPVIPKKGKKYFIHGNIVSTLYPIQGKEGEYVQIDNIVTVSKEEGKFVYKMLDLPAQEQVLAIGLAKAIFSELDEAEVNELFKDLKIPTTDKPSEEEEYDFNLNPSELSLRIVPKGQNVGREIWKSNSFDDVKKLISALNIDIEKDKFDTIIGKIKRFKNRRSIDRLKGMFAKNIRVGDAEAGTEKGEKKQQALNTVNSLEEKYNPLVLELIRSFIAEDVKKTIAVFPGKFKPPHKDHIARIKAAAKDADEVIVIVSTKTEPGGVATSKKKKEELEARLGTEMPITLEQSLELFKKLNLPSNVKVIASNDPSLPVPSPSPVTAAYELFIHNPEQQYIGVFGKEEDLKRFGSIPQNVIVKNYSGAAGNLSATDLRTALKNGGDIKNYMPDGITPEKYRNILNQTSTEADPKVGTGKKPKGSGRRLYTDENPKDTVRIKFSTKQDIIDTLSKASFKAKSHARQSQIINLIHQRVRAAYERAKDPEVKSRLKTALDYAEQRKEASKEKTKRLNKLNEAYIIYPNFQGVEPDNNIEGIKKIIKVEDAIGNEPYKDYKYFTSEKKEDISNMIKSAQGNGWKSFPPVTAIEHPLLPEKYLVIDGNHRLGAFKIGKIPYIKAEILSLDQIALATPESEWEENKIPNILSFLEAKDKVDLEKYFSIKDLEIPPLNKENVDPNHTGKSSPYGSGYKPLVLEISKYMIEQGMEIQPLPKVQFIDNDEGNAQNILGNTAYYNPQSKVIVLYTLNRHPKDILRSFCHEMVHHEQNLKGTLGDIKTQNTTEDSHLDEIEREAYEKGNIMFRNWEDKFKSEKHLKESKQYAGQSENLSVHSKYGVKENNREMRKENEETGGYEIYCDMDGVLCDFDRQFQTISNNKSPEEYEKEFGKKAFWKLINSEGAKFWSNIPWMKDGQQLWNSIKQYNPNILSAPSSDPSSKEGKKEWISNNLTNVKEIYLVPAEEKQKYSNSNSILIDDKDTNIEQWNAKGGIGILHTSTPETIKELKKYIKI